MKVRTHSRRLKFTVKITADGKNSDTVGILWGFISFFREINNKFLIFFLNNDALSWYHIETYVYKCKIGNCHKSVCKEILEN